MPVNYQLGKIYKIVSNHGDKIYVGSTALPRLCTRLAKHRSNYNCWKNGTYGYTTSYDLFDEYRPENCEIILLEAHSCNSKDELTLRERYYIELLSCVNRCVPSRTTKEYYNENKEVLSEYQKEYHEKNKDAIHEYKNTKYVCNICGGKYTQANKSQHFKTKTHINASVVVADGHNLQLQDTPTSPPLTV